MQGTGRAPAGAPADARANARAVAIMAVAIVMLATNDAIVKHVGGALPVGQILALRGLMLCAVLVVVCNTGARRVEVGAMLQRWCLARAACETVATWLFVTSLMHVPIAVATTLVLSAPLGMTALSGPLFGERVGPWRWGAVGAGFVGVALITAPGTGFWDPALALPLGTAVAFMTREIVTRRIPPEVSAGSAALGSALAVTVTGLASLLWGWESVSAGSLGWLALAALFIAGAHLGGVVALRLGELSIVAPVYYVAVPCALIYGALIWGEIPGPREIAGGLVIVGANLLILYRERVHHRRQTRGERS